MSAAGRARIAAAQKARWARVRRNGGQKQNVVSMPKKRTMSAAARRKIAAAQKAEMGEGKSRPKEVGVTDPTGQNGDLRHRRNVNGVVAQ